MHVSMATHICGGELAAVKWSFSNEKASCGMESDNPSKPVENGISSACCQDQFTFCTVDTNYNPSTLQVNAPVNQLLLIFHTPVSIGNKNSLTFLSSNTNVQPPGYFLPTAVYLPEICVFRI